MIAIDTNLLVYAHRRQTPLSARARKKLGEASRCNGGWGISFPVLAEFYRVVTHPGLAGETSTPQHAVGFVRELLIADLAVWKPEGDFESRLLEGAGSRNITGTKIFDLQIALIALENGAHEIWTHDHDFVRLPGLKVIDPFR
jgi:hypothetical protein